MDYLIIAVLLVVSYVLTHALVLWLQGMRLRRIEAKSQALCNEMASDEHSDDEGSVQVPITLITGFLGSGKTTLVNRVLTSPDHGLRVLVIENELGAVSIDHTLIDQARQADMPEGVIVLNNGCMCCSGETPGSELERVLDKLLQMGQLSDSSCDGGSASDVAHAADAPGDAASSSAPASPPPASQAAHRLPFDHVLIETTGLADPAPIVQILARREMTSSAFYLDAVIAVVDAGHIMRHLQPTGAFSFVRRRDEAEKQLALADRVLLNKVDLLRAGGDEEAKVLAAVRRVNASADIVRTTHANVPLSELLDLRAFSSAAWLSHLASANEARYPRDTLHSSSITCVSLTLEAPIVLPLFQAWLQQLLEARHDDIYRLKGVLCIAGHAERFIVHGVHADIHGHFERPWATDEPRQSAIVVIGHALKHDELEAAFGATAEGGMAQECDHDSHDYGKAQANARDGGAQLQARPKTE